MKKVKVGSAILLSTLCLSLPVLATPATATTTTLPNVSHATRHVIRPITGGAGKSGSASNTGWASTNWSGYAISSGTYNDITGSWTVTAVSKSRKATYSSTWIGIDGFNNSDLIQTGTEADYYSGSAHYNAWWEILPAAETPISTISVKPGDVMNAHIHNNGNGTWTITISDKTNGQSFTTTQSYSGPASSAEWIQEAPTVNGRVATLANYGEVTMDPGTVNGVNPGLTAADGGYMENSSGTQIISMPSNPDSDTDGFNVEYGSAVPAPPAS